MAEVDVSTSSGERTLRLSHAILLYTHGPAATAAYATVHPIERGKGGASIGAGAPATKAAVAEFARALGERAGFSGFLSPELLYVGAGVVAWWRAPKPERVWFDTPADADAETKKICLGQRTAVAPHPGLVFALKRGDWYVYALRGAARPTPETKLYRAPYFNVSREGSICEGNLERPDAVNAHTLAAFEQAFFASRFTHPNMHGARVLTTFKGGPSAFWGALLDGRWKSFPEEHLVADGKHTLGSRLKNLEDRA